MKHIKQHHYYFSGSLALAALVLIVVGKFYIGLMHEQAGVVSMPQKHAAQPRYESSVSYEEAIMNAVDRVSPSVVSITISKNVPIIESCPYNPFGNLPPEFQNFFGGGFEFSQPCQKGTKMQNVGGGSGFIVSADGLIVTNKHVVDDAEASYTVFTNDGKKYTAKVLARDPVQDVAVIKIDATGLTAVTLGDSDSLRLGQTVITIGNALAEFRNTVSVGIVSGLSRTVTADSGRFTSERLEGVIQTDAAINPGNSGGPMLNLRGEVIGINTAMASGAQNIGFALPINSIKRDIDSVRTSGKIVVPYLGVRYVMLTDEIAERDNLPVKRGALVRGGDDGPGVVRNSPADKAGVEAEDIITKVGGIAITDEQSLASLVRRYAVGDKVPLTIMRNDREIVLNVILEERK